MTPDPLTHNVSQRICNHMNKDHQDAILNYAKHFGGCIDPQNAVMLEITATAMELEVDGLPIHISFDHKLRDSEDAHQTLVSMLKSIPIHP